MPCVCKSKKDRKGTRFRWTPPSSPRRDSSIASCENKKTDNRIQGMNLRYCFHGKLKVVWVWTFFASSSSYSSSSSPSSSSAYSSSSSAMHGHARAYSDACWSMSRWGRRGQETRPKQERIMPKKRCCLNFGKKTCFDILISSLKKKKTSRSLTRSL